MIRRIPGCHVLRKIPIKKTVKKYTLGMEMIGIMGGGSASVRYIEPTEIVSKPLKDTFKKNIDTISWNRLQKRVKEGQAVHIKALEAIVLKRQKAKVLAIINEDKNCINSKRKNEIAEYIARISMEYGVDPVQIACIAKKETHFTENVISINGKGMMQITQISVEDMYLRPNFYDKKLQKITSKYKTYKDLYKALQTKPQLNMRIGVILYKAKLRAAKGNVKTALMNYNGSSVKYKYAADVYADIQKYKEKFLYSEPKIKQS